jgi:hypothetical protein
MLANKANKAANAVRFAMAKKLPGNKVKKERCRPLHLMNLTAHNGPRACSQIGSPPQGGLRSGVRKPGAD